MSNSNLWLTCSLRPPGYFPPGGQGPGGGGNGDPPCTGDDCDGGETGCDALWYYFCPPGKVGELCSGRWLVCDDDDPSTNIGLDCEDCQGPTQFTANNGITYYLSQDECGLDPNNECSETGPGEPPETCDAVYCKNPGMALGKCQGLATFDSILDKNEYDQCAAIRDSGGVGSFGGGDGCKYWPVPDGTKTSQQCDLYGNWNCTPCGEKPPKGGGGGSGPTLPTTPPGASGPDCWSCPATPSYVCCQRDTPRDKWNKCPDGSYKTKKLCDASSSCEKLCDECYNKGGVGIPDWVCAPILKPCPHKCDPNTKCVNPDTDCGMETPPPGDDDGGEIPEFSDDFEAKDSVYLYNHVDTMYERNTSNRKYFTSRPKFQEVGRGSLPPTLFKKGVHAAILAVYQMNNVSSMLFSDFPYSNLSNDHIEQSLQNHIVSLINQVKLATGKSIRSQVLGTIRRLLISNRLNSVTASELIKYLKNLKNVQSKYPDTRGSTYANISTYTSEAKAIRMAGEKSYPLQSDAYDGLTQRRMQLWKTLSTDLKKNIPVTLSNGTVTQLYYDISDNISLGSNGSLSMSPGNIQRFTGSRGNLLELSVAGEFHRGRILQLEHLQKICSLLGEKYEYTLNVKTDLTSRIDERYGVDNKRDNYYFLSLDPSSVTSGPTTNSFISLTSATYTYETNTTTMENLVKFTPWPFMVFYVDADDPIFNYITHANNMTITSKDFTFDLFEDDPLSDIYLKRVAPLIVLIPSDKDQNVPSHFISRQMSYGEREIKFTINADPTRSDTWDAPYLEQNFSYPDRGFRQTQDDINAIYYTFNPSNISNLERYTTGSPVLPRPKFGMRQLLSRLKDLKENWELTNDTVTWEQVYNTIDRSKMKDLYTENPDWIKTRFTLSTGKISSDDEVNSNYPGKITEVRSNYRKITDTNYLAGYTTVEQKPLDQRVDPPGPIN